MSALIKSKKFLNRKLYHDGLRYGDNKEIYPGDCDLMMEYHLKESPECGIHIQGELKHENAKSVPYGQKEMLDVLHQDLSKVKNCLLLYATMADKDYPYSDRGIVTKYKINNGEWHPWDGTEEKKMNVKRLTDYFIRRYGYKLKVHDEHTD